MLSKDREDSRKVGKTEEKRTEKKGHWIVGTRCTQGFKMNTYTAWTCIFSRRTPRRASEKLRTKTRVRGDTWKGEDSTAGACAAKHWTKTTFAEKGTRAQGEHAPPEADGTPRCCSRGTWRIPDKNEARERGGDKKVGGQTAPEKKLQDNTRTKVQRTLFHRIFPMYPARCALWIA